MKNNNLKSCFENNKYFYFENYKNLFKNHFPQSLMVLSLKPLSRISLLSKVTDKT